MSQCSQSGTNSLISNYYNYLPKTTYYDVSTQNTSNLQKCMNHVGFTGILRTLLLLGKDYTGHFKNMSKIGNKELFGQRKIVH